MSAEPFPLTSASSPRPQWIESAPFDLIFFILAPLLGIALVLIAPEGHGLMLLVIGSVLGIPHYLSTFTFYLWDDTRAYRAAHWLEFLAAPIGLVLAFTALMIVGQKSPLLFIVFWWNAFHIAKQSCGLLSIYRHSGGNTTITDKHIANTALLAVAGCCALWNIELNPTVVPYLTAISTQAPHVLRLTAIVISVAALARLVISLIARSRDGRGAKLPELAFLAGSLALFAPYLWVRDWNRAGFAVLTGHFVQYLGIVWLIHRRKLRDATSSGSQGQRALARLSSDWRLLLAAVLTIGVIFLALPRVSRFVPWPDFYAWFTGVIVFLHFYLDGLFWAMKRPEIRASMAPYLRAR